MKLSPPVLAQMKHCNPISDTGSTPVCSTNKTTGQSRFRRCCESGVDGQRWRGAIRHANVDANKTAKVIAFPASAEMVMAAAA